MKALKLIAVFLLIAAAIAAAYFASTSGKDRDYHFAKNTVQQQPGTLPPAAPGQTQSGSAEQNPTVTMIAAGDIMLSRSVALKIRAHNVDYPFAAIQDYLHSADIVFANLESPITAGPVVPTGSTTFHADPGVEVGLKDAGITVLNLANNHTPNYGDIGIADTIKYLDQQGIAHFGAGMNLAQADQPLYLERNGIKFALLGYNDSDVVPASYGATSNHAGTNIMDLAKLNRDVQAAKKNADLVIVSMHSGVEYQPLPDDSQKNFAHAAIDAGADLVLGHHPHVIETMEKYKGKYIFYSLGNFVFDQAFSNEVREGMTLKITFDKTGVTAVEYNPVWIEDLSQPKLTDDPATLAEELNRLGPNR